MTRRTRAAGPPRRRRGPGVAADLVAVAALSVVAWWLAGLAGTPAGVAGYAGGLVAGVSVAALTPRWATRAGRRLGWRVSFSRERRW
jgi:hypothetical protein